MKHIISFSGGIGSFMAAKRVIDEHGPENVLLVFTDTKTEDADLYRFIDDAVKHLKADYLYLAEGRNIWEVFFDDKYIGNTRNGNCTRTLKQKVFRDWLEAHYKPDECIVYLGIDWTEEHRYKRALPHWEPYTVKAPLCNEPYMDKTEMFDYLKDNDIEIPYLYKLGMSHNNCGGFCVKAGHGHFKLLLEKMPERYAYNEAKELEWQRATGKANTILRNRKGGQTKPMTLKEFREQIEARDTKLLELDDFGGCGCMTDF